MSCSHVQFSESRTCDIALSLPATGAYDARKTSTDMSLLHTLVEHLTSAETKTFLQHAPVCAVLIRYRWRCARRGMPRDCTSWQGRAKSRVSQASTTPTSPLKTRRSLLRRATRLGGCSARRPWRASSSPTLRFAQNTPLVPGCSETPSTTKVLSC